MKVITREEFLNMTDKEKCKILLKIIKKQIHFK